MASIVKPSVEQSLAAQTRPLVLDITTGMDGARLAFVGGPYYEAIAEFGTAYDAQLVRGMASLSLMALNRAFRNASAA